jgi:hypothetical protein
MRRLRCKQSEQKRWIQAVTAHVRSIVPKHIPHLSSSSACPGQYATVAGAASLVSGSITISNFRFRTGGRKTPSSSTSPAANKPSFIQSSF